MVVPERKAAQNTRVFEDIADDETDDEEGQHSPPAISQRPVDEREDHRQQQDRYAE